MNGNTRDALIRYIEKINQLAAAMLLHAGEDTVREIIEAGNRLEKALESDETIP